MAESKTVFYVDDDRDDLEIFLAVANGSEIDAKVFIRADKLLESLLNPSSRPLVVFIDLNMPVISGYEMIERIKSINSLATIPIVVYTTANDTWTIDRCRNCGADYFVTKSSDINKIKIMLQHVVAMDWEKHDRKEDFLYKYI